MGFVSNPSSLTFTWQQGQPIPPAQNIGVAANTTDSAFSATVTAANQWLQVNPSNALINANLTVTVTPTGLAPGTYNGAITLAAPHTPSTTVPVTLVVTGGPPTFTASGVQNAASLISGPVSPGEIVVVNGSGFSSSGVLTAPTGANGLLATQLGGTQVLFDGIPVPLL